MPMMVPKKPEHGCDASNEGKHGEVFFQVIQFKFAHVFHAPLNGFNRLANALDAFVYNAGYRVGSVFCKRAGSAYIAVVNMIADDVHKITIHAAGPLNGEVALYKHKKW